MRSPVPDPLPVPDSPALDTLYAQIDRETLERDESVIYAVDSDLRLLYVNPAWDRFARSNGGEHLMRIRLGRAPVLEAVGPALRAFYNGLYRQARETQRPVEHRYQCCSASTYREFLMRVMPLKDSGLVVINSLAIEAPIDRTAPTAVAEYTDTDRIITMCSHCRRTQRPGTETWDWVPAFVVKQPEAVSHGLCPLCLDYHYLSMKRASAAFE